MASWASLSGELPASTNMATPAAQAWVLAQVAAGNHPTIEWFPVEVYAGDLKATFRVSNRIRIGDDGDSVLPITSADTAQRILDLFDAVALTPKLYDHVANQGLLISYVELPHRDVADLSAGQMVQNSRAIDALLAPHEYGLYEVGKSSVVTSRYNDPGEPGATGPTGLRNGRDTMINYGAGLRGPAGPGNANPWPSVSLPTLLRVWQPPGGTGNLWHHLTHVDISQKGPHLLHRSVSVFSPDFSGEMDIEELASDPVLWPLVSSAGALRSMRIPIDGSATPRPPTGGTTPSGGGRKGGPILATALITIGLVWAFYAMS